MTVLSDCVQARDKRLGAKVLCCTWLFCGVSFLRRKEGGEREFSCVVGEKACSHACACVRAFYSLYIIHHIHNQLRQDSASCLNSRSCACLLACFTDLLGVCFIWWMRVNSGFISYFTSCPNMGQSFLQEIFQRHWNSVVKQIQPRVLSVWA